MPRVLGLSWAVAEAVLLALAGVLVVLGALIGYRAWKRSRITPEERERRRRSTLVAAGKMSDAMLVEIRDDLLFYSYGVRGVEYTASQDVSMLKQHMPHDFSTIDAVSVKYDPKNPANSIVLAERWSGLRVSKVV
ncbi:MAG: hypothetical protein ABSG79_25770 [Bryobacteraceae bacterium]|jgi:hypothetical protein